MRDGTAPARFRWLPPGLRPDPKHGPMEYSQERTILLVGAAALFAGYDQNVFGLAIPQIQAELHIPENQVGLTVAYFRVAAIFAMLLAASADIVGRRRLLLITLFGQAAFTLFTAFTTDYNSFVLAQFLTRLFGYAEEMLCFVVIAEVVASNARGWANGTLTAMYYFGAGMASLVFALVNLLPYGWRAIYVIGLFAVAYLRQRLPETERFTAHERLGSKGAQALRLVRDIARQYPRRVALVVIAASAFGFAISPATVLAQKYLQDTYHYSPGEVTMLLIPGGLLGLAMAILAGRFSDRVGRKPMAFAIVSLAAVCFFLFYSGVPGWAIPPLWILAFFGFFSGDVLVAGFALEIVPTQYRATVSGLRYMVEIGFGAVALALEGVLYDYFGSHSAAIQCLLAAIPITLIAILFLPEPAGRTLEEMAS
jgi:MFS family permease